MAQHLHYEHVSGKPLTGVGPAWDHGGVDFGGSTLLSTEPLADPMRQGVPSFRRNTIAGNDQGPGSSAGALVVLRVLLCRASVDGHGTSYFSVNEPEPE